MRKISFITTSFLSMCILVGATLSVVEATSRTTVEFPAAIHFLNPAGEDVVVGPGMYDIESTESWLKLVPEGQGRREAVLLDAIMGDHEEKGKQSIVRLEEDPGNSDIFHLAVLQPDGTGLEAVGTKSGIRPRGMYLSYLKKSTRRPSTRISRFGLTRPKVGSGKLAPPPRPQISCGPVRTREIGRNIGEKGDKPFLAQPSLAVFRNQIHLRVSYRKDRNWTDHLPQLTFPGVPAFHDHYIFNGRAWSEEPRAGAPIRVALANYNGNLWAVWRDKNKQLWFSRYYNRWAPRTKIPGQYSKSTPALAVRRGVLHMIHNGKSSDDLWHSTFTPQTQWTKNVKIGKKSRTTPGLATGSDGNLHMVYLGAGKRLRPDSKDLFYSQYNGRRWTNATKIPKQYSKASPTLLGAGTTSRLLPVLMVHLGKSKDTLWHSLYGKNPRLPVSGQNNKWHVNEKLLGKTSDGPVALTFFQGCIHMVHKVGKKLMHTKYSAKDVHSGLP